MLWLGLHLPGFGLEVFELNLSEASSKPTVLLQDNRVVLRNQAAHAVGILPGATLATAHTICNDLVFYHRDQAKEQQCLESLAQCLYQLSSQVSLCDSSGLLLEVSRSRKLFNSTQCLLKQALKLVRALGYSARGRIATTPEAAIAMAKARVGELANLPLSALDLNLAQLERFQNMGITHLGPVLALPSAEIGKRFGRAVQHLLLQLTGAAADPRQYIEPTLAFNEQLHLLDPIQSKQGLAFPMQRLLTQLQLWLVGRQLAVQHIRWEFSAHAGREKPITMDVKFAQPQQDHHALLDISRLQLEQQTLPADVLNLSLSVEQLLPWQEPSKDIFQWLDNHQTHLSRSDLLDQLRARLGDEVCHMLTLVDQHHPEHNWRLASAETVSAATATAKTEAIRLNTHGSSHHSSHRPSHYPLWLLETPKPIAPRELTIVHGPERIRTAWWKQGIFRDYYIARQRDGAHCWVFTDTSQEWHIHGYFA